MPTTTTKPQIWCRATCSSTATTLPQAPRAAGQHLLESLSAAAGLADGHGKGCVEDGEVCFDQFHKLGKAFTIGHLRELFETAPGSGGEVELSVDAVQQAVGAAAVPPPKCVPGGSIEFWMVYMALVKAVEGLGGGFPVCDGKWGMEVEVC